MLTWRACGRPAEHAIGAAVIFTSCFPSEHVSNVSAALAAVRAERQSLTLSVAKAPAGPEYLAGARTVPGHFQRLWMNFHAQNPADHPRNNQTIAGMC